ncbi:MAG: beta-eliminating lyase-related protein, partial [Spirochaetales bacterium]|nr:beta-eliminating lyase-related protein [Spirochaetales bacterium]
TAISSFLRPHEAVVSTSSGHIYVHETGSVEATGHKVYSIESADGKLNPSQVREAVDLHYFEHMVKIRLVYISQPTEMGGLYSLEELYALRAVCDELNLLLYIDGARLGSAVTSEKSDVKFSDYAKIADAFYIGGTKNGALFGEALVICNAKIEEDFKYLMKQRGAVFAKGRLMGIQFYELFKDGLYFQLAEHANKMSSRLSEKIKECGYSMKFESYTNQIFPVFPEHVVSALEEEYLFYRWETEPDGNIVTRLICSWMTQKEDVDNFIESLKKAAGN